MTTPHDERTLSILVVDDSALVRQMMSGILSRLPRVRVRVAADPLFAKLKIEAERPDVILLDLETPRMHGLEFLRQLMQENPIPVVVCSSYVGAGSDIAMRALEEGALDVIPKPEFGVGGFLKENATVLLDKLRAAALARLQPPRARAASGTTTAVTANRGGMDPVIAIGASTGGTEAIQTILQAMPANCPPIVITQHMPAGFTSSFARRLNGLCRIEVKEAAEFDRLLAGRALIAPGNRHMRIVRDGGFFAVALQDGPLVSRHKPSVDVLFDSMAENVGRRGIGVICTGMGDDGARGMVKMNAAGALTIAQDEKSCIVFGMPREAIALGGVQRIAPLDAMADILLQQVNAFRCAIARCDKP